MPRSSPQDDRLSRQALIKESRRKIFFRPITRGFELLERRTLLATVNLDGSGNLVIVGTNANDALALWSDTLNSRFVVEDPAGISTSIPGALGSGTPVATIPFASVTGSQILVSGLDGDDSLTIDLSLGNFAKTVSFDGGPQIASDSLTLTGGGLVASVAHTLSSSSSGSVAVTGNALFSYSGLEPITDHLNAAARVFTFAGGAETITLADATGPYLTIDSTLGEAVTFALPTDSLTIQAGSGNDTIQIDSVDAGFSASLVIDGGLETDQVTLSADLSLGANRNLSITAETVNIGAGVDVVTSGSGTIALTADDLAIAATANLSSAGVVTLIPQTAGRQIDLGTETAGRLSLTDAELDRISAGTIAIGNAATGTVTVGTTIQHLPDSDFQVVSGRNIALVSGASWTTTAGDLSFAGNMSGTATGNLAGVQLFGATLRTLGAGNLTLTGFGGQQADTINNVGVDIRNSAVVESHGAGNITLEGTGGIGTQFNDGIQIVFNSSVLSTAGGKISLTGYGSAGSTGDGNRGIGMGLGSTIRSEGTGDIELTGTGGISSGNQSFGVDLASPIQSTGTGKIFISGTGGQGNSYSIGFAHAGLVSSVSGDITITGIGGTSSGQFSMGVWLRAGADIQSTGGAKITVDGTGGAGLDSNRGIQLEGAGTTITSTAGDIHLIGEGGTSSSSWNIGYWQTLGAAVTVTGNANVKIEGTGTGGGADNDGVIFNGFGDGGATLVSAQHGDITIIGAGSTIATGGFNRGVGAYAPTTIQATGSGGIHLEGTGGTGSNHAIGVELSDADVLSASGPISVLGVGGPTQNGFGISVNGGATVRTTTTGSITIDGTGGAGTFSNGVQVFNSGTEIAGHDGNILITGQGGSVAGGEWNRGVFVATQAAIRSTGLATITINGTGGNGLHSGRGVEIGDSGTIVSSVAGDVEIIGQGGVATGDGGQIGVW